MKTIFANPNTCVRKKWGVRIPWNDSPFSYSKIFDNPSPNRLSCLERRSIMKKLNSGDTAPGFNLENQNGRRVRLFDFTGKKLFLYFFPKANTSG
jgi:peroxiredoxin Q/BCP